MTPFHAPAPPPGSSMEAVFRWVEGFVVPLGLCPFARAALPGVRVVGSSVAELMNVLKPEATLLADAPPDAPATTLIVVENGLEDFHTYLDKLSAVERSLRKHGFEGVLQVASFHPQYAFSGEPEGDAAAFSNRAPFPTFHLLRESDVTAAVEDHPDTAAIPLRNQRTLRAMGVAEIQRRLKALS